MLQMQCACMAAEKYIVIVLLLHKPLHMCAHLPVMYTLAYLLLITMCILCSMTAAVGLLCNKAHLDACCAEITR